MDPLRGSFGGSLMLQCFTRVAFAGLLTLVLSTDLQLRTSVQEFEIHFKTYFNSEKVQVVVSSCVCSKQFSTQTSFFSLSLSNREHVLKISLSCKFDRMSLNKTCYSKKMLIPLLDIYDRRSRRIECLDSGKTEVREDRVLENWLIGLHEGRF